MNLLSPLLVELENLTVPNDAVTHTLAHNISPRTNCIGPDAFHIVPYGFVCSS